MARPAMAPAARMNMPLDVDSSSRYLKRAMWWNLWRRVLRCDNLRGVIAVEMARQLEEVAESVLYLGIIDAADVAAREVPAV